MMPQDPPGSLRSPGVFHILRLLTLSCAPALLSCSLEANSASSENVALSVERLVSSLGLQSPATEENLSEKKQWQIAVLAGPAEKLVQTQQF